MRYWIGPLPVLPPPPVPVPVPPPEPPPVVQLPSVQQTGGGCRAERGRACRR